MTMSQCQADGQSSCTLQYKYKRDLKTTGRNALFCEHKSINFQIYQILWNIIFGHAKEHMPPVKQCTQGNYIFQHEHCMELIREKPCVSSDIM